MNLRQVKLIAFVLHLQTGDGVMSVSPAVAEMIEAVVSVSNSKGDIRLLFSPDERYLFDNYLQIWDNEEDSEISQPQEIPGEALVIPDAIPGRKDEKGDDKNMDNRDGPAGGEEHKEKDGGAETPPGEGRHKANGE